MDDEFIRHIRALMGPVNTKILFEHLEAKDKRIAHLEEMFNGWRDEARKASTRIAELEKARDEALAFIKKQTDDKITLYDAQYHMRERIAALEAALKPFADASERCDGKDEWEFMWGLKIGDLRAARAAMEGEDD